MHDERGADVVEVFLAYVEKRLSAETHRGYPFYCQKSAEACGCRLVRDLKPFHVTRWRDGQRWGVTTEYNAHRSVFRAFSWAWQEGLLAANPFKGMKRPRPKARERALTADEYRTLLAASHDPSRFGAARRFR